MSGSEAGGGAGCVSEVTLAISKARNSHNQTVLRRVLDSPDSDESGRSQSFTVQSYDYTDNNGSTSHINGCSSGNDAPSAPFNFDELRIPIVGYEVMEERARFTVRLNNFIFQFFLLKVSVIYFFVLLFFLGLQTSC